MNDYKNIFEVIVTKTADYLKTNGLKTMILGISGGIDSTVTAAICREVQRKHPEYRFIGVSLPCSSNAQDERDSAALTIGAFCKYTDSITHNLQREYSMIRGAFEDDYNWLKVEETKIAQGNIKARLRMMYLYNLASLAHGIVMDTDNLTEHYLGFWTIHGDVGDFNPIGGLWKHEVYGLAKWLANEYYQDFPEQMGNEASRCINALRKAIVITPTDGNGVKVGGDLAQIAPGLTYDQVDDVLIWFLNPKNNLKYYWKNYSEADWPEHVRHSYYEMCDKYGEESIKMIVNRHMNSEFKRKRLPIAIEREEYKYNIVDQYQRLQ